MCTASDIPSSEQREEALSPFVELPYTAERPKSMAPTGWNSRLIQSLRCEVEDSGLLPTAQAEGAFVEHAQVRNE